MSCSPRRALCLRCTSRFSHSTLPVLQPMSHAHAPSGGNYLPARLFWMCNSWRSSTGAQWSRPFSYARYAPPLTQAGRYEEALASLVHAHEFSAAERVCAMGRVLPPEALEEPGWARLAALAPAPLLPPSESQRLRHALAALYMTPSTSSDAFCAPCAHLLHVHASEFALDAVLTAVPAEWPVQALAPFLVRALRTAQHTRRTAHVAKAASLRLSLEAAAQRWHTVRALGGLVEDPR